MGSISFIRVCRDAVSKKSLGYAYVNFTDSADSERAMKTLNHEPLCGRNIRIMRSQRDPGARRRAFGNLFVKNLDPAIDNRDLHETFSNFGTILSCKIAVDEDGVSKGYGFVHFEDPHAAEMAIRNVNGMVLNEKKIFVGPHIPRDLRVVEKNENQFTNIYIKNLKCNTEEELFTIFKKYGSIVSVCLGRDSDGVLRGFGFVNFKEPQAAVRAMEEMNDKNINGVNIKISRAQALSERKKELQEQFNSWSKSTANASAKAVTSRYSGVNLYVKNLDLKITDDLLRETFQKFGTITSCRVMIDENGKSKGFGFVCFASADDATKAVQEMNKFMLMSKPLYVGLAQRKDERVTYIRNHMETLDQVRKKRKVASASQLRGNVGLVPPEGNAYRSPHLQNSFVAQQSGYNNRPFGTVPGGNSYNYKLRRFHEVGGRAGPSGGPGGPRISNLMTTLANSLPEFHAQIIGNYLYFKVLKHERVRGNEQLASRIVEILLGNQVQAAHMADSDHALAQVVSQVVDSLIRG
ncbi:hypothetical protein D0Z00_001837 [Geotrichum galactomycetum]|uniref:Uncharacterized protein n=1 Tax=Geotrichum galactomycetum TaxID=27317 RepID=A0ACB6V5S9_9ASCO|nr:hypothetical protein D0Z00_001837 [Geotrichum candidum]